MGPERYSASVGFKPPDLKLKFMLEPVRFRAIFAFEAEMQPLGKREFDRILLGVDLNLPLTDLFRELF